MVDLILPIVVNTFKKMDSALQFKTEIFSTFSTVDFKIRNTTRDKEAHFLVMKRKYINYKASRRKHWRIFS